jgi:hypothetical protein
MSSIVVAGDTSGSVTLQAPAVAGSTVLTLPVATDTLVGKATTDVLTNKTLTSPTISGTPTGVGVLTLGTAVASTSGTSIDFTGIPSWVKSITVMLNGVSTSGTSSLLLQMGTSGGIQNTGYSGMSGVVNTAGANAYPNITTGIPLGYLTMSAVSACSGSFTITNLSSNIWTVSGNLATTSVLYLLCFAGVKDLAATLDRVRITTVNGTDTFDAGSINIMYG